VALSMNGANGSSAYVCRCGASFGRANGVYRFLSRQRAEAAEPFERQYRIVRQREGYRSTSGDYYRTLPSVPADHPHAREWRIRRESLTSLLLHAFTAPGGPRHVLDLGAGCGWLSSRLASDGQDAVAVDRLDDDADGLGACRHYASPVVAVQADFDALPFAPAQFDVVVFNGSLHYAADPPATLAEARRMLRSGGALAVMDSPMFEQTDHGEAMVNDQRRNLEMQHGFDRAVRPGAGFLTFERLNDAARGLGLSGRFFPSRGPLAWRLGREAARLKLRRAPAAFGVWIAR
jgi:ubiquinone/menaquinone biosynthesis C-methylase UbiE